MNRIIRSSVVLAMAVALSACGGGAKLGGGKEGAAQALFQVGSPASTASSSAGLTEALGSGLDVAMSHTVKGRKGGEAVVSISVIPVATDATMSMAITYKGFNEDGKNSYDGNLTFGFATTEIQATSGAMAMTVKGKVNISGAISDFLEADLTEKIAFTNLSSTSGQVTFTLDGTLNTSTENHTFANESLVISADAALPAAEPAP